MKFDAIASLRSVSAWRKMDARFAVKTNVVTMTVDGDIFRPFKENESLPSRAVTQKPANSTLCTLRS